MTIEPIILGEMDDGLRLDRWIQKRYPDTPFRLVQKILRTGQVRVDGKRVKGHERLQKGQKVRIPPQLTLPPKKENGVLEKDVRFMKSLLLYQDEHILAVNKPAGLAVQGGSKIKKSLDDLLPALAKDGVTPHLVHRLDKDTSGVLLLARNSKSAKLLGEIFQGREIRKYYWAVTVPAPPSSEGKIKSTIAKVAGRGGERMMAVAEGEGKTALTFYRVMEAVKNKLAWVAFWPKTGRTHQIRVHAAEMGCPLLGDFKYSEDHALLEEMPDLPDTLHLHARRVIFTHPVTHKKIDISAPISGDMLKTWKFFGFDPNDKSDPFEDVE